MRTAKSDSPDSMPLICSQGLHDQHHAPGFKTEQPAPVTVVVTETARVDAKMSLSSNTETVEVTSQAGALR